jgi:hypothetical protein
MIVLCKIVLKNFLACSEPMIRRFLESQQSKLQGVILTGMGHITDTLLISTLPKLKVS